MNPGQKTPAIADNQTLPRGMRAWGLRLLAAGIATLVALLLAEVIVRVLAPQNLSGTWRTSDARGLVINRTNHTAQHQMGARLVRYRLNAAHLRGGPLRDQGSRVLVLGDSYVFGWLLQEQDTLVAKLQTSSDAQFGSGVYQFLNGGAGGWGTADYVAFLEEYGAALRPNIVLVVLNTDDIGRSLRSGLFADSHPDGGELTPVRPALDAGRLKRVINGLPGYPFLLEHSHLFQACRNVKGRPPAPHTQATAAADGISVPGAYEFGADPSIDPVRRGQALFNRVIAWCQAHQATLLVTTTGWHVRQFDPAVNSAQDPNLRFLAEAPAFFASASIPFHDTTPELLQVAGTNLADYIIPIDHHPNERGAALMTTNIWRWMAPQLVAP